MHSIRLSLIACIVALCAMSARAEITCADNLTNRSDPRDMIACLVQLQEHANTVIAPIPVGAIIAFDRQDGCPVDEGWVPFDEGAGKFLLGAGAGRLVYRGEHHRPPNVGNIVELKLVELGDQGGAETHALSDEEMPKHGHSAPAGFRNFMVDENWSVNNNEGGPFHIFFETLPSIPPDWQGVTARFATSRAYKEPAVEKEGEGLPHKNMPPYIALHFCKKEAG